MDGKDFEQYLAKLRVDIERTVNDQIPDKIGNKAVELFNRNFKTESFFGQKWQEVQRRTPGTAAYKTAEQHHKTRHIRPILTGDSGALGRSIRYRVEKGAAVVYSDLDYSSAHNDGTSIAGVRHNVRIPQRRFIGHHAEVDKMVKATITRLLNEVFK